MKSFIRFFRELFCWHNYKCTLTVKEKKKLHQDIYKFLDDSENDNSTVVTGVDYKCNKCGKVERRYQRYV